MLVRRETNARQANVFLARYRPVTTPIHALQTVVIPVKAAYLLPIRWLVKMVVPVPKGTFVMPANVFPGRRWPAMTATCVQPTPATR